MHRSKRQRSSNEHKTKVPPLPLSLTSADHRHSKRGIFTSGLSHPLSAPKRYRCGVLDAVLHMIQKGVGRRKPRIYFGMIMRTIEKIKPVLPHLLCIQEWPWRRASPDFSTLNIALSTLALLPWIWFLSSVERSPHPTILTASLKEGLLHMTVTNVSKLDVWNDPSSHLIPF